MTFKSVVDDLWSCILGHSVVLWLVTLDTNKAGRYAYKLFVEH